jgi:sulfur carrier protein
MEDGRPARPPQSQSQLQLPLGRILAKIVTMKIVINGQEQTFAPITLALLIEQLGMKQDRVAVELNRNIVPRSQWADTHLGENDQLEIVHFVGGGRYSERRRLAPQDKQELL